MDEETLISGASGKNGSEVTCSSFRLTQSAGHQLEDSARGLMPGIDGAGACFLAACLWREKDKTRRKLEAI